MAQLITASSQKEEERQIRRSADLVHFAKLFEKGLQEIGAHLRNCSTFNSKEHLRNSLGAVQQSVSKFNRNVIAAPPHAARYGDVTMSHVVANIHNRINALVNYSARAKVDAGIVKRIVVESVLDVVKTAQSIRTRLEASLDRDTESIDKELDRLSEERLNLLKSIEEVDEAPNKDQHPIVLKSLADLQDKETRQVLKEKRRNIVRSMLEKDKRKAHLEFDLKQINEYEDELIEKRTKILAVPEDEIKANNRIGVNIQNATLAIHRYASELKSETAKNGVPSKRAFALIRGAIIYRGRLNSQQFEKRGMPVIPIGSNQYVIGNQNLLAVKQEVSKREIVIGSDIRKTAALMRNLGIVATKSPEPKHGRVRFEAPKDIGQKSKQNQALKKGKPKFESEPPPLTPQAILDTLKAKTGKTYIDVAGKLLDKQPYLIRSSEVPGVVYVWLMEKDDYLFVERGGSLVIQGVSLPSIRGISESEKRFTQKRSVPFMPKRGQI